MDYGRIIFINGTSSSGKTSIVRALQDLLDKPYLEAGIDKFIFMMPPATLSVRYGMRCSDWQIKPAWRVTL